MRRFRALFHARNMEFIRDRGTLFWNLAFPVLLVFGFAFAFGGNGEGVFGVGYVGQLPDEPFFTLANVDYIHYDDLQEAMSKVRYHQIDLLLDVPNKAYYVNESNPTGAIAQKLLDSMQPGEFTQQTVTGKAIRYVDWFVPGLIGMNMMFSGVFGVGFVIVRYRKNGVLKRLKATPVHAMEFVSAQVASRFVIVVITSVVVFTATNLVLHFMMLGSYLLLLLLTMLAVFCMISLGLIFASRIRSEELANGLMNLVIFPMILVSGVFFSLEGSPPVLRSISKAFPLTQFIDGARSIMLNGAGFVDVVPNLLILVGYTFVFLTAASVMFRWE